MSVGAILMQMLFSEHAINFGLVITDWHLHVHACVLNSLLQLTCCRKAKYRGVTNHLYMQAVSTSHSYVAMPVCSICHWDSAYGHNLD